MSNSYNIRPSLTCGHCGQANKGILMCGSCLSEYYCNAQCQRNAWLRHKKTCTETGCQTLIRAIGDGDIELVELLSRLPGLLNTKVAYKPDGYSHPEWTALHQCVFCGNTELLKILLQPEKKADLEITDEGGVTPLVMAALLLDTLSVQILLQAGANPNVQSERGWTPLMYAVADSSFTLTKLLLDGKADVYLGRDIDTGHTALDISKKIRYGCALRKRRVHARSDVRIYQMAAAAKSVWSLLAPHDI